jgi:LacI family transcriptional regulator
VHRVEEAGGACRVVLTDASDLQAQADSVREQLRQILRGTNHPTAIGCATDPMAMTVYRLANELGLSIPRDLSVVGYADFAFAPDMTPALTTVRQDPYAMGRTAGQLMLERISGTAPKKPRKNYIKPELIVRNSTAKPGLR